MDAQEVRKTYFLSARKQEVKEVKEQIVKLLVEHDVAYIEWETIISDIRFNYLPTT